ncbi:MAG TPA: DUF968 domain-containing protein [Gemmatimonadetes bacterium]|nr:DUF968 domain-containing protein [Gemmatimonadota bacterium]
MSPTSPRRSRSRNRTTSRFRTKPWRSQRYLQVIRGEPCLRCGSPLGIQAHHLRHAERRGMARKTADHWAVPLCVSCHILCHNRGNEREWWALLSIDPIRWAEGFHRRWTDEHTQ